MQNGGSSRTVGQFHDWPDMDAKQHFDAFQRPILHHLQRSAHLFLRRLKEEADCLFRTYTRCGEGQGGVEDHCAVSVVSAGVIRTHHSLHFLHKRIHVSPQRDDSLFLARNIHGQSKMARVRPYSQPGRQQPLCQVLRGFLFLPARLGQLVKLFICPDDVSLTLSQIVANRFYTHLSYPLVTTLLAVVYFSINSGTGV